jgi:hypothetical protein
MGLFSRLEGISFPHQWTAPMGFVQQSRPDASFETLIRADQEEYGPQSQA